MVKKIRSLYQRLVKWELQASFAQKWAYATVYGLFWLLVITFLMGYIPFGEPDKMIAFALFAVPLVGVFAHIFVRQTHHESKKTPN